MAVRWGWRTVRTVGVSAAVAALLMVACTEEEGDDGSGGNNGPVTVVGTMEIRYDDQLRAVYVNGQDVIADTVQVNAGWHLRTPFTQTVNDGKLVVAATVYNGGYTGGLMMNINTDKGNFVTNGTSWKWMVNPPAGWEQPAFDDAAWYAANDLGAANETPTMARDSACTAQSDSCPLNAFIATGARFIWSAEKLFFRRTFTIDTACTASFWAGCRGPHTIYVDGTMLVEEDSADQSTEGRMYLTAGSHTVGVLAETTVPLSSGTGGALKVGVANKFERTTISPILNWFVDPPDTIGWDTVTSTVYRPLLVCDTNWRVTPTEYAGWQAPTYDDAAWFRAAVVQDQVYPVGYPGLTQFPAAARTIWLPQTVCFRGTLTLQ